MSWYVRARLDDTYFDHNFDILGDTEREGIRGSMEGGR